MGGQIAVQQCIQWVRCQGRTLCPTAMCHPTVSELPARCGVTRATQETAYQGHTPGTWG